ncbi:D-ribose pyranase [Mycolicibacterium sp. BiH015]|uniref:RbsD/FucU domain-containing protein n=1 Tax=Mycolicibacterium sp. BiH015 TaxID=3018808 RepID=UPI0022DF207D|nr:RbsD/FucU domain-containing protein [Mycolicibacterium sp. BiH015]MDA2893285.1 D-ribose pyranase [Mycolicibacterium sp. BiH015]
MKIRLLHARLAAVVSQLRHGEMLYIADAGSGTSPASLVPLADQVEVIHVGIAPGLPTVRDVVSVLWEVGDFEAAIITEDMRTAYPAGHESIRALVGEAHVHEMRYLPDFYRLRDRVKVFIQTGDYSVHANIVLVAGYPSPPIPLNWLTSSTWLDELADKSAEQA